MAVPSPDRQVGERCPLGSTRMIAEAALHALSSDILEFRGPANHYSITCRSSAINLRRRSQRRAEGCHRPPIASPTWVTARSHRPPHCASWSSARGWWTGHPYRCGCCPTAVWISSGCTATSSSPAGNGLPRPGLSDRTSPHPLSVQLVRTVRGRAYLTALSWIARCPPPRRFQHPWPWRRWSRC